MLEEAHCQLQEETRGSLAAAAKQVREAASAATAEQVEEESVQQISIFHCLEFAVHFQDAESTAAATTTPAAAEPTAESATELAEEPAV